ncbi:Ribose import ATP-binding protein RbsA [Pseudobythopirellula maris]|uniref:Ribose import ATP-binding protein RbsA n=1 Tax=Pseudobythopirellula maris TaxID=2527991 RepID=A0A5C5ZVR9_9BACT|nr:sugar ABC transporter ATP-binding protein [Pseudobythopirellula maris]TWT91051.1 Ribose import ATP-binding protein RbsA [Pseudobythopirellula maris]
MTSAVSTASPTDGVVLEARGVRKAFPGVQALDGARLAVRKGRLNALLGENGAGKSTLMNILSGVLTADEGDVLLDGEPVAFATTREAQDAGVAIIHQELNLVGELSVAENIFLGREPTGPLGLVDYATMNRRATELMERLATPIDPRRAVRLLSVAKQQVVEIAKAIAFESRVLILDEPTSSLTGAETQALFRLIRQLKADGVGLVYITHRLDELREIADDATVLRDGRFVAETPYAATTPEKLVGLMVGREIGAAEPLPPASDRLALKARNIRLKDADKPGHMRVDGVSLTVNRGEIVGLFGLMGAGRTEMLQTLFGLHPAHGSAEVEIDGEPITIRTPRDAIRAGLALAPEDRKGEGVVLGMGVGQNVSMASLEQIMRLGLLSQAGERRLAEGFIDRLAIKTPSVAQEVRTLSGGNQQKVVLAKWLATGPKVLMLDEPTRGVDIGGKQEIYAVIRKLASEGLGVLMASSEMPETLALSHRVLVVSEGRLTAEFSGAEATEEKLLTAALPDGQPQRVA